MKHSLFSSLMGFALLLGSYAPNAQELVGLTTGNYSGTHGVLLNPASMINSKLYLDVQVAGLGVFLDNNYLFINEKDYYFGEPWRREAQLYNEEHPSSAKYTIYDWYTKEPKKVYSDVRFLGPGIMLNYGKHGAAFQMQVRNIVSLRDIPYHVAKFAIEGLSYVPQQKIRYHSDDFQISEMAWAEFDFSYAYRLFKSGFDQLSLGLTAKHLRGVGGLNVLIRDADYMGISKDTLQVYNLDATIDVSVPVDRSDNDVLLGDRLFRGSGWGLDAGIYYQRNLKRKPRQPGRIYDLCAQPWEPYRFKLGFSLIDYGKITFRKEASHLEINNFPTFWPGIDTIDWNSIDEGIGGLSAQFFNDSSFIVTKNRFSMPLPTVYSFQLDYNLGKGFFLNGVTYSWLRIHPETPWRPKQLILIPRYESRFFSIAAPFSWYDGEKARLGLALRLFFLNVGVDRLGPIFERGDFTGQDIYFSFKINFTKGYCGKKSRGRECPNYEYKKFMHYFRLPLRFLYPDVERVSKSVP